MMVVNYIAERVEGRVAGLAPVVVFGSYPALATTDSKKSGLAERFVVDSTLARDHEYMVQTTCRM
jgi:hypothetical protein